MLTRRPAILVLGLALATAAPVGARERPASIRIEEAWSRPTAAGAAAAVGYLRIVNRGDRADHLLGGSIRAAARLEIHQSSMAGGVMRMRDVEGGVDVPPRSVVTLSPGGYHLMFVAPKQAFHAGDRIPATLDFARAGKVRVSFVVGSAPTQSASPAMPMPM